TLLDRTFEVSSTSQVTNYTDTVPTTATQAVRSSGGINDLRFAGAWTFGSWLSLGAGLHIYTGQNQITESVTFSDTIPNQYLPSNFTYNVSYSGIGGSVGLTMRPLKWVGIAASYRDGGDIRI